MKGPRNQIRVKRGTRKERGEREKKGMTDIKKGKAEGQKGKKWTGSRGTNKKGYTVNN